MALLKNNELIGLIPLAGKGERMRPITSVLPKALIEIEGKTFLERAIDALKEIGVNKIVVVTGYLEEKIHSFLDSKDFAIQIERVSQNEQLGLAHAIFSSKEYLTSDFVLFCPDSLYINLDDLRLSRDAFNKYKPAALQTVTLATSKYQGRLKYSSHDFNNISPNLFNNSSKNTDSADLTMYSTGLAFISKKSLDYLVSLKELRSETGFFRFMSDLRDKEDFMLHLMKGTRYDFTEPDDIDYYRRLQSGFSRTLNSGVSAILINQESRILLQLRDNIPSIRYPAHWALFGGTIDQGETPYQCIEREIREEIGYGLVNYGLFREFIQNNKKEYAFIAGLDAGLSDLVLGEGREMRFFSPDQLASLKIRPDDKETLKAYLGNNI